MGTWKQYDTMIKITDARVKQSNLLESVESIGHLIYTNAFRPLPSLEKKKERKSSYSVESFEHKL